MRVAKSAGGVRRGRAFELRALAGWLVASRWRATFFLILAGMCFTVGPILRYCKYHRYFAVRAVDVQGGERLDAAQVRVWLGMVEGSSIWDASPGELEAKLESHPAIARARVRRLFPDRILVTLKEREPRAILRTESGAFFVDRSGAILGEAALDGGDLPILTLTAANAATVPTDVRAAGAASRARANAAWPASAKGAAARGDRVVAKSATTEAAPTTSNAAGKDAAVGVARPAPLLPSPAELRRAVRVAQWLERGEGGVGLSELALKPGQPHPELVAFSNDGKLAIRLGWGDWRDKLTAVRLVLENASRALAADAARSGAARRGTPPPASQLAGTIDVHDPAAVVVRWAQPGGAA